MLTDDMRREGWLPWDGGPCPVAKHLYVDYFSSRFPFGARHRAGAVLWEHVTAYKPENPNGQ